MKSLGVKEQNDLIQKVMSFSFFSSGNYPYVCARVRAKRAHLLSGDVYAKLLMMDVHEITRFLGESVYKKEITELGLTYSGFELTEIALNRNLAVVSQQILGYCEDDLSKMLSAYLQHNDVWNIKTILRGKFYHASVEEIMKTLRPAGKYSESYWRNLVQTSKTMEEVIDHLEGTEYYEILHGLREKLSTNLADCENTLEAAYYISLLKAIRPNSEANKLFLRFVHREIDLVNLRTLFMTKFENVEPQTLVGMLIPGGEISEKELQLLVDASDFPHFLDEVQKLPYYNTIRDVIGTIEQTGSLNHVIRALEKEHLAKATKSSYLYPLSILPILDYLIRKRIEVENLRILVRGKEKGLSEQVIREMLVM
jgi:V/A-type H+-transporting ATPase subunit C